MSNEKMTADILKLRTKKIAVEIVKYYRNLPKTVTAFCNISSGKLQSSL